jgi:D-sedoheptulose 7-phosphate isomerase
MGEALEAREREIAEELLRRRPDLAACAPGLLQLHGALVACYDRGGTLYTCGNGGSHADAVHIVGELNKSFERRRTLEPALKSRLTELPCGSELADHLETGLRAHALGLNGALKTAIENDIPVRDIAFAQELHALVRKGDVLLALSTSGNAANCQMAMSVARAHGATAVALVGRDGGAMARQADIAIVAPGESTRVIQEAHIALWHAMCCLIEVHYFPERR